jgi:hypothetical protein
LFLASLPPGFPQNPNVLLIRTHPNPLPSVANTNNDDIGTTPLSLCGTIYIHIVSLLLSSLPHFHLSISLSHLALLSA